MGTRVLGVTAYTIQYAPCSFFVQPQLILFENVDHYVSFVLPQIWRKWRGQTYGLLQPLDVKQCAAWRPNKSVFCWSLALQQVHFFINQPGRLASEYSSSRHLLHLHDAGSLNGFLTRGCIVCMKVLQCSFARALKKCCEQSPRCPCATFFQNFHCCRYFDDCLLPQLDGKKNS